MNHIDISRLIPVKVADGRIVLRIRPIYYLDGRKPRLPRRTAPNYPTLKADTVSSVLYSFQTLQREADTARYRVSMVVCRAADGLGAADLDNYCKPILDALTRTKKVWRDDKQIDNLAVTRLDTLDSESSITVEITRL
jgi:hypothetical protein